MSDLTKSDIEEIVSTWSIVKQDVEGNGLAFFTQ